MTEDELIQHAEQFHTDFALAQHRRRHPTDPDAVSAESCEDCGNDIPEARRKVLPGITTCIDCAREAELKERLGR